MTYAFRRTELPATLSNGGKNNWTLKWSNGHMSKALSLNGASLIPFDMATGYGALWELLGSEFQRDVRKWSGGNGLFVVIDEVIDKSEEPDDIRAAAERMREKGAYTVGALRLAYEGIVRVSRSYYVHVSEFPLLPPNRDDTQGSEDINLISQRPPSTTEMRLFREALRLISRRTHPKSWPRFITAFQRFNRAFRGRDEFENFVDLVVALEGLFGVREEELRFRLAVRAALLLGDGGAGSSTIYREVTAAYHIRNTLVHGQGSINDIESSLMKEVTRIVPLDSSHPAELREAIAFGRALQRVRQITRRALWGYARLQGLSGRQIRWPKSEQDWDEMLFKPTAVRNLRRELPF